uniref:INO80 complex subunit E N-terminal domain-containing protein n=1 Tax=Tetranychus urticae TaxID=32264 RepID=T1KA28_TETUR
MPLISDETGSKPTLEQKQKYRNLKKKLKLLIYENEYYQEELKKYQKELLIINRDKYFLMDKLLKYENISSSSSDSDATESSESEVEVKQERPASVSRRRRIDSTNSETTPSTSSNPTSKRRRINSNGSIPSQQKGQ